MHRYLLKPDDSLLLIIDIQEKFYNAMENGFREMFLKNSRILIQTARALNIPIILSEQMPSRFGKTVWEISSLIQDIPSIEKIGFSCWRDGKIRAAIKGSSRNKVIITGIESHVCVLQTVMDFLNVGYHPVVAMDAVCSRFAYHRISSVNSMEKAGAVVYPTESIVFMLMDKIDMPLYADTLGLLDWDIPTFSSRKNIVAK